MDRPWPRGTSSMFFIWSSIWATLLSLFSIRRRSEKSASRERERGQNTHSARMKGGAQKHWRQNGFHSQSGGRPEVPYFFFPRPLVCHHLQHAFISSARHMAARHTFKHKSSSHALHEVPVINLFFWGRGLYANLHKPGSQRQAGTR